MTTNETAPADDLWLTPADLAQRLRVSVKTVRRELDRGHLTGHRIGSQWRIAPADLAEYLAARRGGDHG